VLTLVKVKLPPPAVAAARVNITFLQHALFLRPFLGADLPSARPFNNKCLPTLFVTDNVVVVSGGEIKLTLWKHLKGHAAEIRASRAPPEKHTKGFIIIIIIVIKIETIYNILISELRVSVHKIFTIIPIQYFILLRFYIRLYTSEY